MASYQGLNIRTVQAGNMEAWLLCEHFFKTLLSPTTTVKSMLHMCIGLMLVHFPAWTRIKYRRGAKY
jgi:hypothetical protein